MKNEKRKKGKYNRRKHCERRIDPEEKVDTCNAYASGIKVNTTVRNNFTDIITNETIRTFINGIVTVDGDSSSMNGSILITALMVLCQPLQHLKVEKNMCISLC